MRKNGNTFFLLRHGQTNYNVEGRLAGKAEESKPNPPHLTEVGEKQIMAVAEKLADMSIDIIYSSPFARTMRTATIVSESTGAKVLIDNRLREVDIGVMEGKTINDWEAFFIGKNEFFDAPPGAESLKEVYVRALDFLTEINDKYGDKHILVVSHGDVLWAMKSIFMGIEGDGILKTPYIEPGTLEEFEA